jgi:hypothetical protein
MRTPAALRQQVHADLRALHAGMASTPRALPRQVSALLRERCDLNVVKGAVEITHGVPAQVSIPGLGSMTPVSELLVLDQLEPGEVTWWSDSVDDAAGSVCFVFSMALGNGSGSAQPTVTFTLDLDDRQIARFCLVKNARQWVSDAAVFAFHPLRVDASPHGRTFVVDDALTAESIFADGLGIVLVDRETLGTAGRHRFTLRATSELASRNWCRVGIAPWWHELFLSGDELTAISTALAPREASSYGGYRLLLGDLHSHSGESHLIDNAAPGVGSDEACGVGSRAAMFEFARDVAGLDFFCLSEHDWQMDEHDWRDLRELNDRYGSDAFTTIHGYEWTSLFYGHRNVYFGETPGSLFYSQDPRVPYGLAVESPPSPRELWQFLRREGIAAITVPHHMSAAQFPLDPADFFDADFDRVAEIYSSWGDSLEHHQPVNTGAPRIERLEFLRSVRAGRRSGFIASSDSHDGHPGFAQGTEIRPHIFHHLGSGRAGVFVDDATRDDIFGALHQRRTFAATGDGMRVWTSLDGRAMGTAHDAPPARGHFELVVDSDAPLSTVLVYRNGAISERIDVTGSTRIDTSWPEPSRGAESIFVKAVRLDGEAAWSSPHWNGPQSSGSSPSMG